jgi:hypothetical protein
MVRIPIRCLWVATGNNPTVSGEIGRRSIRIRMDAKQDRPWLREGFKHPNLRQWVEKHRAELVWAALTIVQNWIALGKPAGGKALGMFRSWADTIGGILDAAGIPGFLGNLMDFYDKADVYGAIWRAFVGTWWEEFGNDEVGVTDLFQLVIEQDDSLDLGDGKERSQRTRLGKLLSRQRDRRYQVEIEGQEVTLQIALAGTKNRANQWQLIRCNEHMNVNERSTQSGQADEKRDMHPDEEHTDISPGGHEGDAGNVQSCSYVHTDDKDLWEGEL